MNGLTLVVHGESGVGKSHLADTAPGPRLILDVEGGTQWTPSNKVPWDPRGPIPELGPEDSALVTVTNIDSVRLAFQWLNTTAHPFRSVVVDSLSELQRRSMDGIAGDGALDQQGWGTLLRQVDGLVRGFRDLKMHPSYPVQCVVFVCGSAERGQDHAVVRPALSGSMRELLGYHVDVMAYLSVSLNAEGGLERRALFANVGGIAAKDRTGRLGVTMDSPSIPRIIELAYRPKEVA